MRDIGWVYPVKTKNILRYAKGLPPKYGLQHLVQLPHGPHAAYKKVGAVLDKKLMPRVELKTQGPIPQGLPEQRDSVPTLLDQLDHFLHSMGIKIREQLRYTPNTGKARILGTGPLGQTAAFQNQDLGLRIFGLKAKGAVQTHDPASNDGEVHLGKPGPMFPIAQFHKAKTPYGTGIVSMTVLIFWIHYKAFHEFGGIVSRQIIRMFHKLSVKGDGGLDPFDHKLVQGPAHLVDGLL